MGVDKKNARFVHHHDVCDSVDSYYQEIGRDGHDSNGADAVLFYHFEDLGRRRFFASGGKVDVEAASQVVGALRGRSRPVQPTEPGDGVRPAAAGRGLEKLAGGRGRRGVLPTGGWPNETDEDHIELYERATRDKERHKQFERSRVEMMRGYAELRDCRRGYMLNYFGEGFEEPCGRCDNCEAGVIVEEDEEGKHFPLRSRVAHKRWGEGTVQRYEGEDKMVVLFD